MTNRAFPFTNFVLPGLDDPIATPDESGNLIVTDEWRRFFEGLNFQRGGDGGDAVSGIDGDVATLDGSVTNLSGTVSDLGNAVDALETQIATAVSDSTITPAEKLTLIPTISALQAEETELVASAANRNISSTAYESEQDTFAAYLATLTSPVAWNSRTGNTTVDPDTFTTRYQALVTERDELRSLIDAANIRTTNIASNAVSDVVAQSTASAPITTTNPKRTNSLFVIETADLTNFESPGKVLVTVDFEHEIDLGAYDWCVMRLDLRRQTLTGGGADVFTLRSWRWVQAGSSTNGMFPVALETNNQTVTQPQTFTHADTLPTTSSGLYDATGYKYVARIYVTDEWDDGSTMIDGYDSPSSNAKHHRIVDLDLILTHLRR